MPIKTGAYWALLADDLLRLFSCFGTLKGVIRAKRLYGAVSMTTEPREQQRRAV
jgi:hypothetical protein